MPSHSRCSLITVPLMSTRIARGCPSTREAASPIDWPTVDVITDRNGLGNLLRWLNPSLGREIHDFRIDVQLVGTKTLVLRRWESLTRDVHTGRSYGYAFEVAMTRAAPDCPSSGHQRVITYVRRSTFPFFDDAAFIKHILLG